ncbi:MAG: ArsA family ATPase [Candidatus Thorarchaeota archaeon]
MARNMSSFYEINPDVRIAVFAGKGGLGKTTCSAALSMWLSKQKKNILCFSTDPQASLSDIFEKDVFGKGAQKLAKNLFVMEIDADKRIAAFQEEIRQQIKDMYGIKEIPKEIDEYISAAGAEPAMHESATYDAMAGLLASEEYDLYVFDMPPFGHGIRIVSMARILDIWVEKMEETRRKAQEYGDSAYQMQQKTAGVGQDQMLAELQDIRKKLGFFQDILTDSKRTAFYMVVTPEKMSILDTERALQMFEQMDITLSGIIVNQVYPKELLERTDLSPFLRQRIEMQQRYMVEIEEKLGNHVCAVIPMFDREPKGLEMISKVSDVMMSWNGKIAEK